LDTAIIVSVMIGSVVAMALVFAKVVLGVAWTGKSKGKFNTPQISNHNNIIQNLPKKADIETTVPTYAAANQELTATKNPKTNKFYLLVNKHAYTCDNLVIGNISSVLNGMLIIGNSISKDIRYEIPIYYIRQNLQSHIIMDIPSKDLEHYIQQLIVSRQK
jgi:hypothetical protein